MLERYAAFFGYPSAEAFLLDLIEAGLLIAIGLGLWIWVLPSMPHTAAGAQSPGHQPARMWSSMQFTTFPGVLLIPMIAGGLVLGELLVRRARRRALEDPAR